MALNDPIPRGFATRFWARVRKRKRGCWEWQGYRAPSGYGVLQARKIHDAPLLAHRVAWRLRRGPIPDGAHVLHRCDNPRCVRLSHLFLGTQSDNNADRQSKGRTASGDSNGARTKPGRNPFVRNRGSGLKGEAHPQARLSQRQVAAIRRAFERGEPRAKIAARYGISVTHVYRIASRKSWGE